MLVHEFPPAETYKKTTTTTHAAIASRFTSGAALTGVKVNESKVLENNALEANSL
jgi:hypothetical protein